MTAAAWRAHKPYRELGQNQNSLSNICLPTETFTYTRKNKKGATNFHLDSKEGKTGRKLKRKKSETL